ncbi:hypothetical protein [Sporosarcina sp. HYO08]|uniref:hypothetical protein n=1 Tax=Sporosarcina sp. HYO08 TaxID=1759557 RepID=UPI00079AEA14|nr:hypothetical protein [Sporosarcina sp. HYO08]KXH87255.1 hypothetical protein AU377_01395 [Sporosarcina sp. HYO08]
MGKVIWLFTLVIVLAACGANESQSTTNGSTPSEPLPPAEATVEDSNFVYRLFTEKDVYDEFGDTAIFAELTYVGEKESIDIYHAASPFYFPIEERIRGIKVDYAMNEPLIVRTLKKGEPFREKYIFAGGYSDADDGKSVDFIKTLMDKGFPEGEYIIHGSAQFSTADSADLTDHEAFKMKTDIGFTVTKPVNK